MANGSNPSSALPCGPRLLVPIQVKVLLKTNLSGIARWADATAEYGGLQSFSSSTAVAPFSHDGPIEGLTYGAVVSWSLPPSLTKGGTDGTGASFPPVPNRWLVLRSAIVPPDSANTPTLTAWVVESDYVDPLNIENPLGLTEYPCPPPPPTIPPTIPAPLISSTNIGRVVPYASWPDPNSQPTMQPPLQAVGPGDVTFAAYAPGALGVFSCIDPLTDPPFGPQGVTPATLTYGVVGWYADPALDPLAGAQQSAHAWATLASSLGWSVGDETDLDAAAMAAAGWAVAHRFAPGGTTHLYPTQILCHGVCFGAEWPGQNAPLETSVPPDPNVVTIAFGNTTAEALATLIANQVEATTPQPDSAKPSHGQQIANLIEAFQYNLLDALDSIDGTPTLTQAMHDGAFASTPGGTIWQIAAAPGGPAALPSTLVPLLAALNTDQAALDHATQQVNGAQTELFTAWWRSQAWANNPPTPPQPGTQQQALDYYNAQTTLVTQLQATQSAAQLKQSTSLNAVTAALAAGMKLKKTTAPPFRAPLDPVVLIAGAGMPSTLDRNGPTGDSGLLFCRFSGQTLRAIDVAVAPGPPQGPAVTVTVAGSSLAAPLAANPNAPVGIAPVDIADLAVEQLLLDTSMAPAIATQAVQQAGAAATWQPAQMKPTIKKQQTIQWNQDASLDQQSLAELAGLIGTVPCQIAADPWAQPWAPLYLDWQVTWFPSAVTDWQFDGEDFTYVGGPPAPSATGVPLTARTLLTPMAASTLHARMEAYAGTHPESANAPLLANTLDGIADADLLSQRLSGFAAALQTLAINQPTFLSDPGAQFGINPGVLPYDQGVQFSSIRHGHFLVDQLWVVDAFGQAFAVYDNGSSEAYPPPLFAPSIATDYPLGRYGRLPPRLSQPSRLSFDLVDALDPTRLVGSDPGANPVCGWLLPNHLDESIAVYDADGTYVGELALSDTAANGVRWWPAPGGAAALGAPPAIGDPTLLALIASYLLRPDAAAAYAALLDVIDETMSNFSPIDTGGITAMAAAIGNPVAVARARVTLGLNGPAALSQLAQDLGANNIGDLDSFRVPFKLGSLQLSQDALLAYFRDGNYGTLLSPAPSANGTASTTDFTLSYADGQNSAELLLLMDPRGVVHAATGLLPVRVVQLPSSVVDAPLRRMAVTFEIGPVLTDQASTTLPLPALGQGTWTWLDRPTVASWSGDQPVTAADARARLPATPPVAAEGWLKMSNAMTKMKAKRIQAEEAIMTLTPLLSYSAGTQPATVSPGLQGVTLNLIATNETDQAIAVSALTVTVPIGDAATDLSPAASAATIAPQTPTPGWMVSPVAPPPAGGLGFTLTPAAGTSVDAGSSVVLTLSGIVVNAAPGTANIPISEQSAQGAATATISIAKMPSTKLTYTVSPSTLNLSQSGAALTINAINTTATPVSIQGFKVTVPIGDAAYDLATAGTAITASRVTPNCDIENGTPGVFVVKPRGSRIAPSTGIVIALSGFDVGPLPGIAYIYVAEPANQPIATISLPVEKAPLGLAITRFQPVHDSIAPGGSTSLEWTTVAASSCKITSSDVKDGNPVEWDNLPPNSDEMGSLPVASPLDTRQYTLYAKGGTEITQQMTTVTVTVPRILDNGFTASRASVGVGDTLSFDWQVEYASGGVTLEVAPTGMDAPAPFTLVGATGEMGVQTGRSVISPVPLVPTNYTLIVLSNIPGVNPSSQTINVDCALQAGWAQMASPSNGMVADPDAPPVMFTIGGKLWLKFGYGFGGARVVMQSADGSSWSNVSWPAIASGQDEDISGVIVRDGTLWRFRPGAPVGGSATTSIDSSTDGVTWTWLANANPLDTVYQFGGRQSLYVGVPNNLCAIGGLATSLATQQPCFNPTIWSIDPATPANEYNFNFTGNVLPGGPSILASAVGTATEYNGTALAFWSQIGFVTSSDGVNWSGVSGPGVTSSGPGVKSSVAGVALQPTGNELWLLGGSGNPQALSNTSYYHGSTQTGPLIYSAQNINGPWTQLGTPQLPAALAGCWLATAVFADHLWVCGAPMQESAAMSVYLYNELLPGASFQVTTTVPIPST